MIQAIGLTSACRSEQPPSVDDLTFEACPGRITVLLGAPGAGKTSVLRLALQLQSGRGVALFRGRPMRRVPYPVREVGVLLGGVPGHPRRTARGYLRMLTAVAGVPVEHADDVLDVVGLSGLSGQRLEEFSLGMDRRLALASALLGDPHTLVLDEPAHGLSVRDAGWLHGLLRGFADQGGTVLTTARDVHEAARIGDRVVTIEAGRLVADQEAAEFRRTRLRPRVSVCTPHAERLVALLDEMSRRALSRPESSGAVALEAVRESVNRVSVYGSDCAAIGELVHRHGIALHGLSEETAAAGETAPSGLPVRAGHRSQGAGSGASLPSPAPHSSTPRSSFESSTGVRAASGALSVATSAGGGANADTESAMASAGGHRAGDRFWGDMGGLSPAAQARSDGSRPTATVCPSGAGDGGEARRHDAAVSPEATASEDSVVSARSATPSPRAPEGGTAFSANGVAPPRLPALPPPSPVAPLRYELHRMCGVRTAWIAMAVALCVALAVSVVVARTGLGLHGGADDPLTSAVRLLVGWPAGGVVLLPPVAVASGLLGAWAFGQEFRYPALTPAQVPVPRRLSLLLAKLCGTAAAAVVVSSVTALVNASTLVLLFGSDVLTSPVAGASSNELHWAVQALAVFALPVGCAWVGLLAAGIFRSSWAGAAAVVAVPLLVAPAVRALLDGSAGRSVSGFPERLAAAFSVPWPSDADHWTVDLMALASQPLCRALVLVLVLLFCAYALVSLLGRIRAVR